jgi:hypothetical protein
MLAESWRIECCGIDYCAPMVLTAEEEDERHLFALIGAHETRHAGWLAPWLAPESRNRTLSTASSPDSLEPARRRRSPSCCRWCS